MPYVQSSAISRIEWDAGTLSIWFHESGKYDYYSVPEDLYLRLLTSRSKGQFFNDHIRDKYGR
jgi:KTSC domain